MQNDIYNSLGRIGDRKKNLEAFKNGRCTVEFLGKMLLIGPSPFFTTNLLSTILLMRNLFFYL